MPSPPHGAPATTVNSKYTRLNSFWREYKWRIWGAALVFMLYRTWPSGEQPGSHEMKACASKTNSEADRLYLSTHKGRGIVITVSSQKKRDMDMTLANLKVIRNVFKNSVPVELWYHGHDEAYPPEFLRELCDLGGIRVRDIARYGHCKKYYCKVWAAQYSSFDKMLILDSNALLFQNPDIFFGYLESTDSAIYLYRDYVSCFHSMSKLWVENWIGVSSSEFCTAAHQDEIDSSAVVIDKTRGGQESITDTYKLAHYFLKSTWLLGDKDMWLLSALRTATPRTVHDRAPAFFTFLEDDGAHHPYEGHLHLDANNEPLYGNFQMVSVCAMASNKLNYFVNKHEDEGERFLPYCEGQVKDEALKSLAKVSNSALDVMHEACGFIKAYRRALGDKSFTGDKARSCPWTCGKRPLPSIFTCS